MLPVQPVSRSLPLPSWGWLGVQAYTDQRLGAGVKPATINRELSALKRMFSLAVQTRKGFRYRPYIPLLAEENAREGFLEPADFAAVCAHLPADLADSPRLRT
jgi:hypothetical protein